MVGKTSPERASYELSQYLEETLRKHIKDQKDLIISHGGLKCKKGCSYCCEQAVSVSIDEALAIYKVAEFNKIILDWKKIEQQANIDLDDWTSRSKEARTCALLTEEKVCSIYEYRPYTCRKYLVFNDPSECNVENEKSHETIKKLCSPHAEMAIGGAWNATNDVDTLPRQLLKARDINEKRSISNESKLKK